MLTALIGPIATLAGTWFENKVEKTKADGQAKVAEAKARASVAEKVAAGEVAWEGKMADATVDSWKDEFALVVLLLPAILVFLPGMKDYVKDGFEILASLPEWYQYLLFGFCFVFIFFPKYTARTKTNGGSKLRRMLTDLIACVGVICLSNSYSPGRIVSYERS